MAPLCVTTALLRLGVQLTLEFRHRFGVPERSGNCLPAESQQQNHAILNQEGLSQTIWLPSEFATQLVLGPQIALVLLVRPKRTRRLQNLYLRFGPVKYGAG